jgi:hypothetical protein
LTKTVVYASIQLSIFISPVFARSSGNSNAQEAEENRLEIEEAVFMQSYIPTSLHDLANPYMEADRLRTGQREPSFQAAVNRMLGAATATQAHSDSSRAHDGRAKAVRGGAGPTSSSAAAAAKVTIVGRRINRVDDSDDSDNDDSEDDMEDCQRIDCEGRMNGENPYLESYMYMLKSIVTTHCMKYLVDAAVESEDDDAVSHSEDEDDGEGSDDLVESAKYRKQLPSREDPEVRRKEKEARKEARKQSKAEKAEKRQHKIPKHLKKKAVKAGKK